MTGTASDSSPVPGAGLHAGPVRVRAPATSANLGPGFDALGIALTCYDEVSAEAVHRSGIRVSVHGEGADTLPLDERHLVVRAMRAVFRRAGVRPAGLELVCRNGIPQARGMGSSSAAIVAGILLARALLRDAAARTGAGAGDPVGTGPRDSGPLDTGPLDTGPRDSGPLDTGPRDSGPRDSGPLDIATALEGHPDNVAACLLGGLTIAWRETAGVRAVRLEPSPLLTPVLLVPVTRGLTAGARAALPGTVPHGDAAFNAGRAALLVHALTRAPDLLMAATEDRLHQPYRAAGMPATAACVARLRDAGVPATVSGAGPSVLAFEIAGRNVPEQPGFTLLRLGFDLTGAWIG